VRAKTAASAPLLDLPPRHPGRPLVVFLPGLGASRTLWSLVEKRLTGCELDIVLADRIGAPGRRTRALMHVPTLAKQLAAELADERDVVLVGHSVGTFVALSTARLLRTGVRAVAVLNGGLLTVAEFLDRPARTMLQRPRTCLQALHLFALVTTPVPSVVRAWIARSRFLTALFSYGLVSDAALDDADARRALVDNAGHPEILLALWWNRHHWRTVVREADDVTQPLLFLAGRQDPLAGETDTNAMAALFARARVETVDHAGHALPLEAPDLVATTIRTVAEGSGRPVQRPR